MPPILSAKHVVKRYRQRKQASGLFGALKSFVSSGTDEIAAVDDISFDLEAGEAVGYLGPNGAGKSTMIKMMTGILVPTHGHLSVLGRVPHVDRMKNTREIGTVFGQRSQLWWDLPVSESFDLSRHIYGMPEGHFRKNLDYFVTLLDLNDLLLRPVRNLSLGQRMRCEIVLALLHDPKIVFLDEPTIGLDVVAKDIVRKFLRRINLERGVTLVVTSHDMQDIEAICPRLLMVDNGKLLFDGDLSQLRNHLGTHRRVKLQFSHSVPAFSVVDLQLIEAKESTVYFEILRENLSLLQILERLPKDLPLEDVRLEEPDTDEVIRAFYGMSRPEPLRVVGA
ncbi:ABC transporter ATP-binding protein [Martelella mangrovi]|uniref:ABC-2 type transport system ATP-binding protein n=1 Tax=Martelella mangrovi TaxID=1397477 RepID=A0ABV2ID63_9HYPH